MAMKHMHVHLDGPRKAKFTCKALKSMHPSTRHQAITSTSPKTFWITCKGYSSSVLSLSDWMKHFPWCKWADFWYLGAFTYFGSIGHREAIFAWQENLAPVALFRSWWRMMLLVCFLCCRDRFAREATEFYILFCTDWHPYLNGLHFFALNQTWGSWAISTPQRVHSSHTTFFGLELCSVWSEAIASPALYMLLMHNKSRFMAPPHFCTYLLCMLLLALAQCLFTEILLKSYLMVSILIFSHGLQPLHEWLIVSVNGLGYSTLIASPHTHIHIIMLVS